MLTLKNAWLQCAVGRSFKSLLGVEIVVEILQLELIDLTKRLSSVQIFQIMCANIFLKCKTSVRNLQSFRTGQDVVFMFSFLNLEYNEVVQSCKNSIYSKF